MAIAATFPTLFATPYAMARTARLTAAIQTMLDAQKAGEIANPRYVEAKDYIDRALEEAWDAVRRPVEPPYAGSPEEARKFAYDIAFINGGIHGWHKTIQKKLAKAPALPEVKPLVDAARAFVAEVAPIAECFAFFAADKSRIVKRQPKPADAVDPRYVAPTASTEASRKVKAMLEGLVANQFAALIEAIRRGYQHQIDTFVASRDKRLAEYAASDKPNRIYSLRVHGDTYRYADMSFLSRVIEDNYGRATGQVVQNAAEIVAACAQKDAEEIKAIFVAKNLRKIVSIIEAKEQQSPMTNCEALAHTVSLGGLEGSFVVNFADGSGFEFHNSAVFVTNSHGTRFMRFPLRFSNVTLAGGTKMARPSEERMNTAFLGKEAA